jgi:ABC-2 type transport system ATP-binding protein
MPSALLIDHLTVRFGRTMAVDDLTVEVPQGKIYGFLGENGAGKTTTIRVLMGLLRPNSGRAEVLGENPLGGNADLLQRIGYVSDDRAMYRWMRVDEVLGFNAGLYQNWDKAHATRLRDEFELEPRKRVKQLSRGQIAKLALLCALAPHPELLILDEASSGLDPIVRRTILEKLIDVASQEGTTIFLSSHLLEEVDRVAERIAILCRGRLIAEGDKDTVRASLSRLIIPGASQQSDLNGEQWVLSSRRTDNETQVVVRGLNGEKMELIKKRLGGNPQVVEMSLEDVFAEYTAWGKKTSQT